MPEHFQSQERFVVIEAFSSECESRFCIEYFICRNGNIHQEMVLLGNTNNKDWFYLIRFSVGYPAEAYCYFVGLLNQPHFHLPSINFAFNIHTFLELSSWEWRWGLGLGNYFGPQGGLSSQGAKLFCCCLCEEKKAGLRTGNQLHFFSPTSHLPQTLAPS